MTTSFFILDNAGVLLSAKLEKDARGVVLHSRGGADRNRDYRQALETMLIRLDDAGIRYDIYLDSRPVQFQPLERRLLAVAHGGPVGERFNALVRAMNAGSRSNGAWRRLLVVAPSVGAGRLAAVVGLRALDEAVGPDLFAEEGRSKLVAHLRRERAPELAAAKRSAMIKQIGRLECERWGVVPSVTLAGC